MRKGKWKAITNVSLLDDLELYDLEQDPKETKNLALQYPEKVRELKKIIIETRLNSIDWPISAEVWQTFIEN